MAPKKVAKKLAKKTSPMKKLAASNAKQAKKAAAWSLPKKALKTKTPKRSAKRVGKVAPKVPKPRGAPSAVKKGQIYIDNEDRAGGPRKLAVERIAKEESQPDRWGNPKADRRYAECRVIQNDVEQARRVRMPLSRLVEPAYTLEGAGVAKASAPREAVESDDTNDDGDGSEE